MINSNVYLVISHITFPLWVTTDFRGVSQGSLKIGYFLHKEGRNNIVNVYLFLHCLSPCSVCIIYINSKKSCSLLKLSFISHTRSDLIRRGNFISPNPILGERGVFSNWRLSINSCNHFRSFYLIHLSRTLSWWPRTPTYPRHGYLPPLPLKR